MRVDIEGGEWREILEELGLQEPAIRKKYQHVFHLETSARHPEIYNKIREQNAARRESVEALAADSRTGRAWGGGVRVIEASRDWEDKVRRLIECVEEALGGRRDSINKGKEAKGQHGGGLVGPVTGTPQLPPRPSIADHEAGVPVAPVKEHPRTAPHGRLRPL